VEINRVLGGQMGRLLTRKWASLAVGPTREDRPRKGCNNPRRRKIKENSKKAMLGLLALHL